MRQRDIFWFWLPLFASWLLMTTEGPFISATINRLPDETLMLAAQGVVLSLSIFIEAPIINMLSTATALVKHRQAYDTVRRFTIHWMILLTIITALVGFVPAIFDLVVRTGLGINAQIAYWVRPGMQIMLFWSAAIAWRRFLQGVLIQFKRTRYVAYGTAIRLTATIAAALVVALGTDLAGVYVGACGLMTGVIAEALFAHWATRPLFKNELAPQTIPLADQLSYQELFWFHLPLAASSVLVLMVQPLVTFFLARLDNADLSLAAWPVLFQLMLLARAPALALPEAVIALTNGPDAFKPLRRFTGTLAALLLVMMLLLTLTPLASYYIFTVQDMTLNVGALALDTIPYFFLFPALSVVTFWIRGLLISQRATRAVNVGVAINVVLTVIILFIGLWLEAPGLKTAAATLNLALIGELFYLGWEVQKYLASQSLLPKPISG